MTQEALSRENEDLRLLMEAFERFAGAGETITRSYEELTAKIDELNLQLEQKNRELARNLEEKERLSVYLANVLESLGSGIMVLDSRGRVDMANAAAARLLSCDGEIKRGSDPAELCEERARPEGVLDDLLGDQPRSCEREFEFFPSEGEKRIFRARCHPMIGAGEGFDGRILLLEDAI